VFSRGETLEAPLQACQLTHVTGGPGPSGGALAAEGTSRLQARPSVETRLRSARIVDDFAIGAGKSLRACAQVIIRGRVLTGAPI
jgi:hypothetical protein